MERPILHRASLRSGAIAALLSLAIAGCTSVPPGSGSGSSRTSAALGGFIELDENTDPRFTHSDEIDPIGILIPAGTEVFRNGQVVSDRTPLRNNAHVRTGTASGARIEFNARAQSACRIQMREFRMGQLYGETRSCNHQLETRHGVGGAPPGDTQYHVQTAEDRTVFMVLAGRGTVTSRQTPDQSVAVLAGQDVVLTDRGIRGPRIVPKEEIQRRIQWRQKFAPYYGQRVSDNEPEYYGTKVGQNVVFVLDVSGSMEGNAERSPSGQILREATRQATKGIGGSLLRKLTDLALNKTAEQFNKLAVAKRQLVPVIQKLSETTRFTVLTFANSVTAWQPSLVTASSTSKKSAIDYVKGLSSQGGTAVARALEQALRLDGAQTIFLVSDGQPTDATPTQIIDYVRELNVGRNVRINAVGLGSDQDRDFMSTLASQNGGKYASRIGGL